MGVMYGFIYTSKPWIILKANIWRKKRKEMLSVYNWKETWVVPSVRLFPERN